MIIIMYSWKIYKKLPQICWKDLMFSLHQFNDFQLQIPWWLWFTQGNLKLFLLQVSIICYDEYPYYIKNFNHNL